MLQQWSYCSLALSHRCIIVQLKMQTKMLTQTMPSADKLRITVICITLDPFRIPARFIICMCPLTSFIFLTSCRNIRLHQLDPKYILKILFRNVFRWILWHQNKYISYPSNKKGHYVVGKLLLSLKVISGSTCIWLITLLERLGTYRISEAMHPHRGSDNSVQCNFLLNTT